MTRGKLITLEGSEGSGKSTQAELLSNWLKKRGLTCLLLREPGGTPLGEAVRHLLKHDEAGEGMCSEAELFLFAASRAELVHRVIQPALERGTWIVCDRFLDSTTVYQGYARGVDVMSVVMINQLALKNILPDLTLVFDISVEQAQERLMRRPRPVGEKRKDRIEREPQSFFERVREGYHSLARQEPERVKLIDGSLPREEVFEQAKKEVVHAFKSLLG